MVSARMARLPTYRAYYVLYVAVVRLFRPRPVPALTSNGLACPVNFLAAMLPMHTRRFERACWESPGLPSGHRGWTQYQPASKLRQARTFAQAARLGSPGVIWAAPAIWLVAIYESSRLSDLAHYTAYRPALGTEQTRVSLVTGLCRLPHHQHMLRVRSVRASWQGCELVHRALDSRLSGPEIRP